MRGGGAVDQRDALLRGLRRRRFCRVRVAGADALVAFVPDAGEVAPALRERLRAPCDQRLYPTPGGHLVKWPYGGESYDPKVFRLEPGGWNHEHCWVCNATLCVDETCWITARGSFFVLCKGCQRRLGRLARAKKPIDRSNR
jgi:hypothetical protein